MEGSKKRQICIYDNCKIAVFAMGRNCKEKRNMVS